MPRERTIPCTDCDRQRITLTLAGFNVLGCAPAPSQPDFCIITFEELIPVGGGTSLAQPTAPDEATSPTKSPPAHKSVKAADHAPLPAPSGELTHSQIRTCEAIVNIFETGSPLGDYSMVTLIPGDTGGLTYGRSQASLLSGNLGILLAAYCANPGAKRRTRLTQEMPRFESKDKTLERDDKVKNLLRICADDPVMREVQDSFFTQNFVVPALNTANTLGIRTPLGMTVVYDSFVHGSWKTVRTMTDKQAGTVEDIGEQAWIHAYVLVRKAWLAGSARRDLRRTVYRMDSLMRLIELGAWGLSLPLVVRGVEVSQAALSGLPPGCFDGPAAGSRPLALQQPLARGLDVRLLQFSLSEQGVPAVADGVFGPGTVTALKAYQLAHGLIPTGQASIDLLVALTHDLA